MTSFYIVAVLSSDYSKLEPVFGGGTSTSMIFDRSLIAIVDRDVERSAIVARTLQDGGLAVVTNDVAAAAIIVAPSDQTDIAVVMRGRTRRTPILGYAPTSEVRSPAAIDAMLPPLADHAEFVAAVAAWLPPPNETIERLAAVFGRHEAASLLLRLHERLSAVVACRIAPEAHECHQLAGFAGMLGYTAVHESFERLSVGDDSAITDALRDACVATANIERHHLFHAAD